MKSANYIAGRKMRMGDITGFDDAEVLPDDVPDESDLVIDTDEEGDTNDKQ